jgi:hypothetical protein
MGNLNLNLEGHMAKKAAAAATAAAGPKPVKPKTKAAKTAAERLEQGRDLVVSYLMRRDGMDRDLAAQICAGFGAEEINALIEESNNATIAHTKESMTASAQTAVAVAANLNGQGEPAAEPKGAALVPAESDPDAGADFPDIMNIEFLQNVNLSDDPARPIGFADVTFTTARNARIKNAAEKEYKIGKATMIRTLKSIGMARVNVHGIKLTVYPGVARFLSPTKLLEKGVDIEIINQCWEETPWEDVRITVPKGLLD